MSALAVCVSAGAVQSDVVQLKDNAEISGKILAEKRDQVAIDIGYTVLVIPRNQIEKILKASPATATTTKASATPKPVVAPAETKAVPTVETAPGFYSANAKAMPEKTVRDLVNQLGDAVVQVRTPSGLGSGFIINADGFLMTNFHVIEGETQISVAVYHQRDG